MAEGRFAPLRSTIWTDPEFIALSANAQRVYLLALSQPNVSFAGALAYTEKRWAGMASDTTRGSVADGINELEDARFVFYDDETEELIIRSFVRHNRIFEQRQLHNALKKAAHSILSPALCALWWAEQTDEVKALVGRLNGISEEAGREPLVTKDLDLDLDLEPQPEPVEGNAASDEAGAGEVVQWTDLVAENASPSFLIEGDGVVAALVADYGSAAVEGAFTSLAIDGESFQFASHLAKRVRSFLGDPPAKAAPHPRDSIAAAARRLAEEGAAQLAAVKAEAAALPSLEERAAKVEARRAERLRAKGATEAEAS